MKCRCLIQGMSRNVKKGYEMRMLLLIPGFLTPVVAQIFFPKSPNTFLTCFCRGEKGKCAGKKIRLNRGSDSQTPDDESDTLTRAGRNGAAYLLNATNHFKK